MGRSENGTEGCVRCNWPGRSGPWSGAAAPRWREALAAALAASTVRASCAVAHYSARPIRQGCVFSGCSPEATGLSGELPAAASAAAGTPAIVAPPAVPPAALLLLRRTYVKKLQQLKLCRCAACRTARYRKRDGSLFGGNNADAAAGNRCTPGPCRAVLHTPLAPDKLHCTVALSIPNVGLVDNALNCGAKSCLSPCACAAIQVEGRQLPWYCWDVLEGGRCPAFHTQLTVCVPRIRG